MNRRSISHVVLILLLTLLTLPGCNGDNKSSAVSSTVHVTGAGSTFAAPLYKKWIEEYRKIDPSLTITYDAVGSGEGTKRFLAEAVDFGASDAAMTDKQMAGVTRGVQLVPATAGAIVLAYNIPDVQGQLRLSRSVYTNIFLGKIRYWNDPRIQADNPELTLPDLNIVTVVRSDSSGTTWAFTNHLSSVSRIWGIFGPGIGKEIDFPGNAMFAKGNEGIATKIKHSWGSIGYVEYGFAKRSGLAIASLENKAGKFVEPTEANCRVALEESMSRMKADFRLFLPDPDGENSYPIVTYSWLLLFRDSQDKLKDDKLKEFVRWGLQSGQEKSSGLGYIPLPHNLVSRALEAIEKKRK